jgi:hypothetical protein
MSLYNKREILSCVNNNIIEKYHRIKFIKSRLEWYETNYDEQYDKYNKIMYEFELKDLLKCFKKKLYITALKKHNIEL